MRRALARNRCVMNVARVPRKGDSIQVPDMRGNPSMGFFFTSSLWSGVFFFLWLRGWLVRMGMLGR